VEWNPEALATSRRAAGPERLHRLWHPVSRPFVVCNRSCHSSGISSIGKRTSTNGSCDERRPKAEEDILATGRVWLLPRPQVDPGVTRERIVWRRQVVGAHGAFAQ
jgi:hypothetical protein